MFQFYAKECHQILERDRDEKRRHLADHDGIEALGAPSFEEEVLMCYDIETALRICTPAEQRRFRMYLEGYSLVEIARMERRDPSSVRETIEAAINKIKKNL